MKRVIFSLLILFFLLSSSSASEIVTKGNLEEVNLDDQRGRITLKTSNIFPGNVFLKNIILGFKGEENKIRHNDYFFLGHTLTDVRLKRRSYTIEIKLEQGSTLHRRFDENEEEFVLPVLENTDSPIALLKVQGVNVKIAPIGSGQILATMQN